MKRFVLIVMLALLFSGMAIGQSSILGNKGERPIAPVVCGIMGFNFFQPSYFGFMMQVEGGIMNKEIPVFFTPGLGFSYGQYSSKILSTSSTSLRVPAYFGYLFGDVKKLHVAIRGGVVMDYLVAAKEGKQKIDLTSLDKRTFWGGSARLSVGIENYVLMTQYDFPFQSGSTGNWIIGISIPF